MEEYRRATLATDIDEISQDENKETEDDQPLITLSNVVDKTKLVKQLFPQVFKRRKSSLANMTNKIVNVFKVI